jgi:hypothetical protein
MVLPVSGKGTARQFGATFFFLGWNIDVAFVTLFFEWVRTD